MFKEYLKCPSTGLAQETIPVLTLNVAEVPALVIFTYWDSIASCILAFSSLSIVFNSSKNKRSFAKTKAPGLIIQPPKNSSFKAEPVIPTAEELPPTTFMEPIDIFWRNFTRTDFAVEGSPISKILDLFLSSSIPGLFNWLQGYNINACFSYS